MIRIVEANQDDENFFESKIRPILHEHCFSCHGEKKQWSGLRVDSINALKKGGENGPAIVPLDPSRSLLIKAVERNDSLEMPPDYALTDNQIADLKHWIQTGAHWPAIHTDGSTASDNPNMLQSHWAFRPIASDFSTIIGSEQVTPTCIDEFLDIKRAPLGIQSLGQANPRTLVRRLYFDLTGLPPTFTQVQQFEQNPAPENYEALVDELLRSRQFGEQMARMWLDIARYSDTKGYVYAREERFQVHANTYRDWVVQAFQSDLPYDRFLQYQIAADRYATHDPTHLAAMGFLTLGRRFLGVTHDIIDDRIDVVTRSTMGLTVSCARCHDHKYDPIPTEDYYSLYGVFHNSTQRQIELVNEESFQPSSSPEWRTELVKRQTALSDHLDKCRREASQRARTRLADYLYAQSELQKFPEEGFDQVLSTNDLIPAFVRRWERYLASVQSSDKHLDLTIFKPWFLFAALSNVDFETRAIDVVKTIQSDFSIHPWIAREFSSPPKNLREVADRYGRVFSKIIQEYDADHASDSRPQTSTSRQLQSQPFLHVLYSPSSPCVVPHEEIVAIEGYFDSATCTELWRLQGEVDRWFINNNPNQRVSVALFDRDDIVLPRIFKRGVPSNKGKAVGLHYLSMFPDTSSREPIPFHIGSGRWELADQITHPNNPLTPRVWVNRLWQHFFGQGIVKSTSDFGLRSDDPSHPELLDWLASDLVGNGWSTKSIVRKIVLSRAYQLSSGDGSVPKEVIAKQNEMDPENRFVWRHSLRRLKWEEQCDAILSASGRLELDSGFVSERRVAGSEGSTRRALYGFVDRQFLPNALRVFDFANPDLSIGRRSETTIPQQSLYFLNSSFVASNVRAVAKKALGEVAFDEKSPRDYEPAITNLFHILFQRQPTEQETQIGLHFLKSAEQTKSISSKDIDPWTYGICKLEVNAKSIAEFKPLPHFSGTAWQGSSGWPDSEFGWAQLTAEGGHPGNDLSHAVVRRWTAPAKMTVSIASLAKHQPDIADGVRFHIFHNEDKLLASVQLKASESRLDLQDIQLDQGDRINFVVDIVSELNTDQFLWAPVITKSSIAESATSSGMSSGTASDTASDTSSDTATEEKQVWNSQSDFRGPEEYKLNPWEQFVHVLMCSNEFLFVD